MVHVGGVPIHVHTVKDLIFEQAWEWGYAYLACVGLTM